MQIRALLYSLFLLGILPRAHAQTCCSGGVPLTGNLGMQSASRGTWQISPSYDLNHLKTLKNGAVKLDDFSRQRTTQSLLLETGYSITDHFQVSALFTYVFQTRNINFGSSINRDFIHGIGDAVLLFTYRLVRRENWEMLMGAGPKLPLGRSDMRRSDGIAYNADLQPGSGAWDGVAWGLLSRTGFPRSTSNLSIRAIYRLTGTNHEYLGFTSYRFGNELQLIAGVSEQLLAWNTILNPSFLVRYRRTDTDYLGGTVLPNTGGNWIFIVPGLVYRASPRISARLAADIPVFSQLEGIQLTSDFRITAGLLFGIGGTRPAIFNEN